MVYRLMNKRPIVFSALLFILMACGGKEFEWVSKDSTYIPSESQNTQLVSEEVKISDETPRSSSAKTSVELDSDSLIPSISETENPSTTSSGNTVYEIEFPSLP